MSSCFTWCGESCSRRHSADYRGIGRDGGERERERERGRGREGGRDREDPYNIEFINNFSISQLVLHSLN